MPTSVMPKGVEHRGFIRETHQGATMPTSVMPKGVEHEAALMVDCYAAGNAHLCDAERR